MIDSELLQYLIAFSELGSLTKVGEALSISQPSLSKAMQKLEDELGVTLFVRSQNKMTLNENGKALLPYAKDAVATLEAMAARAKDLKERTLTVSIGLIAPGPMFVFPSLFSPGSNGHRLTVSIDEEEELLKGLGNNKFDIIFIAHKPSDPSLLAEFAFKERLFISVPREHFLAGMKDGVYFKDIDGQTFLLNSGLGYWHKIHASMMPNSRFLVQNNYEELNEIAKYSSIPRFVSNASMQRYALSERVNIPLLDKEAYLDFFAVVKKGQAHLLKRLK